MTSAAVPLLEQLLIPLTPWLGDPAVEDIAVNGPGCAWVNRRGSWEPIDLPLSLDELVDIAILAGSLRQQEIGAGLPLCSTELPGGQRLEICMPPTVPSGSICLSMRVHEPDVHLIAEVSERYRTEGWTEQTSQRGGRDLSKVRAAFAAKDFAAFLHAGVDARLNMLLVGSTGAGKTTLSKTVISAISPSKRIVTIEDTIELKLVQPNVVRLLYSKRDLSGTGISSATLVETGMRLRPDIFLLQELRDEAAWSYLNAICSGHPGSITTIHGRDPADALRRLSLLVKGCEEGRALAPHELVSLISDAVDVIIPLDRDGNPRPRIHDVWFVGAENQSAADLLKAA